MSKEIEQRIIEQYEQYVSYLKQYLTAFEQVSIPVLAFESELSALRAERGEKGETENSVFLIHKDGNTTMLYKNGVIVSPEKFTEFYGCEMTDEQKKLLKIAKENYFKPVEQSKLSAEDKQRYVVGFLFTEDIQQVVLIRKNKPEWQKGKLNGVGGKIEINETPLNAMIREYREEATMIFEKWDNFLTIEYKTCVVYFFKGFSDEAFEYSKTKETEKIEKININGFPADEVIPNLNWIINLALDGDIQHTEAMEAYHSPFKGKELPEDEPRELPTDEMIEKYYPTVETGAYNPMNFARQEGAKWLRDKIK